MIHLLWACLLLSISNDAADSVASIPSLNYRGTPFFACTVLHQITYSAKFEKHLLWLLFVWEGNRKRRVCTCLIQTLWVYIRDKWIHLSEINKWVSQYLFCYFLDISKLVDQSRDFQCLNCILSHCILGIVAVQSCAPECYIPWQITLNSSFIIELSFKHVEVLLINMSSNIFSCVSWFV